MDITQDVIDDFRFEMRDFRDVSRWPDEDVETALYEAKPEAGGPRWGKFKVGDRDSKARKALYLLAAHYLSLTYPDSTAADGAVVRTSTPLNIASKSVGDTSLAYRVGEMQSAEDDYLSTTIYGTRFLKLRQNIAGGVALGGVVPNGFPLSGNLLGGGGFIR